MESFGTIVNRLYNNILGKIKNITPEIQTIPGERNPERMHSLSIAPEYALINNFAIQTAFQAPPTSAESIRESDIGSLEEWGELVLKRSIGENESIEDYRDEILTAWRPFARGGNRQDLLYWALTISGIRRIYPYVGSAGVDEITATDIEGRLNGSYVYVRNDVDYGLPTSSQIQLVKDIYLQDSSISVGNLSVVPIIKRNYDFEIKLKELVSGGGSSLGEVQSEVIEIIIGIMDQTEPYIKYVDDLRRDIVIPGQFLQRIVQVISRPPYRYMVEDLIVYQDGSEIVIDFLPQGNVPVLGVINFV